MNQPATHDELTIKFANLVFFGEIAAAQLLSRELHKKYLQYRSKRLSYYRSTLSYRIAVAPRLFI